MHRVGFVRTLVKATVLMAVFLAFAAPHAIAAEKNPECLICHEAGQEFEVGPVDKDTACRVCHTPGLLGTHPYHQQGANCGAYCHPGWGDSLLGATPTYLSSAGSFASPASKDTSAGMLHQIHSVSRWPAGIENPDSECSSCHLPAACTACHESGTSATHETHSSTDNSEWTGMVCFGIIGEDQSVRSATLQANYCSTSECHDSAGVADGTPLLKEDFSHIAYPEYGYPEANTVTKVGAWGVMRSTAFTGGQQSYSNDPGATLSLPFAGERIALVGDLDPYRGRAEIWIDGTLRTTVDCYSSTTRRQQTLWTSSALASGPHTVTVKALGTKDASSRGAWVAIDCFRVYSTADGTIAPGCADTCHLAVTPGHGSGSHLTHISAADPRGPGGIGCEACHDSDDFPAFAPGTDSDASGHVELDETTACDTCHSPGGDYNGVDSTTTASGRMSVGAKDNWVDQVYVTTSTLQPDKDKWCAGCHDGDESTSGEEPSLIEGVYAPPVIGGEDADYIYGTGWGFYETGHGLATDTVIPSNGFDTGAGLECAGCHDNQQTHIDGDRRTFTATGTPDDYRSDYRLSLVDGDDPMVVPLPYNTPNSADNYQLCTQSGCHDPYPFLNETVEASSNPTLRRTNFWNENRSAGHNMHLYHVGVNQINRWAPDWGSTRTSMITCISCHNVHGSQYLGMIHDGSLISDTVTRTPGLRMWYYDDELSEWNGSNQTPPAPEDVTLAMSEGWIWSGGSSGHLCSHCHGNWNTLPVSRTLWQDYGIAPVLDWVGTPGYEDDGADPDSASAADELAFKITYSDGNNDAPIFVNLLIDLNDDGDFVDASEVQTMTPDYPSDLTYFNGNGYSLSVTPAQAGDNELNYRFETSDGVTGLSTTPTRTVTIVNAVPELPWTGETGYTSDGVAPDGGNAGVEDFEFRITYRDADDEGPVGGAPSLLIDNNDDGDYDDAGESITMTDMGDPSIVSGKRYSHTTTLASPVDDTLNYRFEASDGSDTTLSSISTVTVVPDVNLAPSLAWTGEAEYTDDGVDPENQAATKPFFFRVEYTDANNDAPSVKQVWIDLDDDTVYEPAEKFDMTQTVTAADADMVDGDHTNGEILAGKVYVPYAGDGTLKYCLYFEDSHSATATGVQETDRNLSVYTALYVPSQYATIQLAVDAATTSDTVLVADGTYTSFAYNGKDITVESVNGPGSTFIETALGYMVNFNDYGGSGSDSTLTGFTIRNGQGGVASNKSDVVIENCIFENITWTGAINHTSSADDPLEIRDCIFRNNVRYTIQTTNSSAIVNIFDTEFSGNTTVFHGAAIVSAGGTLNIERCTFDNNSANGRGGAITAGAITDMSISDSTFTNNTAGWTGGAINFPGNATATDVSIDRCVFAGNSANQTGGALCIRLGDYEITNCTVAGNYATGNGGGVMSEWADPTFTNCTFVGNSGNLGGGVYASTRADAQPVIHNCILWGNESRTTLYEQIDSTSLTYIELQYTDIDQGFSGFRNQAGNMRSEPLFVSPVVSSNTPTATGDYHLQATSPCEGRASSTYAPAVDIDSGIRPAGTGDDMGSDEIGVP